MKLIFLVVVVVAAADLVLLVRTESLFLQWLAALSAVCLIAGFGAGLVEKGKIR